MSNLICPALGIHYPIILGGLASVGTASLAAAVSGAGGLGLLGAGGWDGIELERQIKKTRALTKHAFGVNIPIHAPHAQRLFETVMGEGIKVISTSAGDPRLWTPRLKENDIFVMHVVPTVAYAVKAEAAGVDAVVAEGSESGGRTGSDEISTMALIPQTVDAVKCPVIAAGGIGDGRGVAAALALGAAGVQMGTVFLATEECEISQSFKEMLIAADATDAGLFREGTSARRYLKEEFQQAFGPQLAFDLQQHVFLFRVECNREIGGQGPGSRGPDQYRYRPLPGTVGLGLHGCDECVRIDHREAYVDGGRGFILVIDFGFGQRRAAVGAPVHGLVTAYHMSIFDNLAERTHDVGLGFVFHRQVGVKPVTQHAETDEIEALLVDLLERIVTAGLAKFIGFDLDPDLADIFFHLVLDRQTVTIPARHIGCVFPVQGA